jgi:hypothetical protein
MKQPTDSYQSYLLRLWQEERAGVPIWHASLESVQTRERWGFVGLAEVFAFLNQQIQSTQNDNRKDS